MITSVSLLAWPNASLRHICGEQMRTTRLPRRDGAADGLAIECNFNTTAVGDLAHGRRRRHDVRVKRSNSATSLADGVIGHPIIQERCHLFGGAAVRCRRSQLCNRCELLCWPYHHLYFLPRIDIHYQRTRPYSLNIKYLSIHSKPFRIEW